MTDGTEKTQNMQNPQRDTTNFAITRDKTRAVRVLSSFKNVLRVFI